MAPRATCQDTRAISFLAQLLDPFAGQRADRVARSLLTRFGTLARALSATEHQISAALKDDQDVARMIYAARSLIIASLKEEVEKTAVDVDSTAFQHYLILKFRGKTQEELHAIFVDRDMKFLSEDLVSIGDAEKVDTGMSPILRRGLEVGADAYFLVHNHPSQSPEPSQSDIRSTRSAQIISGRIGLRLVDHLIVAGSRIVSLRALRLL